MLYCQSLNTLTKCKQVNLNLFFSKHRFLRLLLPLKGRSESPFNKSKQNAENVIVSSTCHQCLIIHDIKLITFVKCSRVNSIFNNSSWRVINEFLLLKKKSLFSFWHLWLSANTTIYWNCMNNIMLNAIIWPWVCLSDVKSYMDSNIIWNGGKKTQRV